MSRKFKWGVTLVSLGSILFLAARPAFTASMIVFDFDQLQSQSKKGVRAAQVEAYMEGLFGSDVSLSLNTTALSPRSKNNSNDLQRLSTGSNVYLTTGKGKGAPTITVDFGDNPIDSFSVDFQLFRKAKNFSIVADGVVINQQTLTKAQRKTGLTGHQIDFFFDAPVETLQFIGSKKKSFGIDNLVINITPEGIGGSDVNESGVFLTAFGSNFLTSSPDIETLADNVVFEEASLAIPEPSSLLLLAFGLGAIVWGRKSYLPLTSPLSPACSSFF